jgi:hypothetical protein
MRIKNKYYVIYKTEELILAILWYDTAACGLSLEIASNGQVADYSFCWPLINAAGSADAKSSYEPCPHYLSLGNFSVDFDGKIISIKNGIAAHNIARTKFSER